MGASPFLHGKVGSRVSSRQGTHSRCLPLLLPGLAFALAWIVLQHHSRVAFALALLWHLLDFAPGHALHSGHQRIGLSGMALSALPAGSTLVVPLARALHQPWPREPPASNPLARLREPCH